MATVYKPIEAIQLLKPACRHPRISPNPAIRRAPFSTVRPSQATHTTTASPSPPPRRQVTIANDTGSVRWNNLSTGEKAARATQQSFNFAIIITGVVLTGGVGYFLFSDIFSPSSKTAHFNRATTRIRQSRECTALLGPSDQIYSYGEASWSRWARNRFIHSTNETDKWGTEHLRIRFYVEGPKGQGVVHVHLARKPSQADYEYVTLAVDVKGHQRIYLENAEEGKSNVAPKILGVRWW
ncbi:TIM21-domain-containing protein [Dendryphion nanum]|uniref:Mitochondrial import inner membrane translocase subunit Tim21 n=1 Tax=Dendryphion nanum TaxID=256645 RepID=A0A9P9IIY7_9PLEO|nr:TIM21-domain-containing protein [Dendryphion nanum]